MKKTFMLIFFLITLSTSQKVNAIQENLKILEYENVYSEMVFDCDSLPNIEIDVFGPADTTLSNHNYKIKKIGGGLLDMLAKFTPINKWHEEYDVVLSYKESIRFVKEEHDVYYVGTINVSSDFKSLIFMVTPKQEDDLFMSRELFLINICNNNVSAVIKIADYSCFEGTSQFSHTIHEGEHFKYKEVELSSDVISDDINYPSTYGIVMFSFDQYGRVVVNK